MTHRYIRAARLTLVSVFVIAALILLPTDATASTLVPHATTDTCDLRNANTQVRCAGRSDGTVYVEGVSMSAVYTPTDARYTPTSFDAGSTLRVDLYVDDGTPNWLLYRSELRPYTMRALLEYELWRLSPTDSTPGVSEYDQRADLYLACVKNQMAAVWATPDNVHVVQYPCVY